MSRQCPFCDAQTDGARCRSCGRDPTAPRFVCSECGKMTPEAEDQCSHCGAQQTSDLAWKVPVIILLFVAAFVLAFVVQVLG